MEDYYNNFYIIISNGIYKIFLDEYELSKKVQSNYNQLQNFQLIIQQIPHMTENILSSRWNEIALNSSHMWLEKYYKSVLFSKLKTMLDNFNVDDEFLNIPEIKEYKPPSKEVFLHAVLCESAKTFYKNPFLFQHLGNQNQNNKNEQKIKDIITSHIKMVIQRYLPSQLIFDLYKPENIIVNQNKKRLNHMTNYTQTEPIKQQIQPDPIDEVLHSNNDTEKILETTTVNTEPVKEPKVTKISVEVSPQHTKSMQDTQVNNTNTEVKTSIPDENSSNSHSESSHSDDSDSSSSSADSESDESEEKQKRYGNLMKFINSQSNTTTTTEKPKLFKVK